MWYCTVTILYVTCKTPENMAANSIFCISSLQSISVVNFSMQIRYSYRIRIFQRLHKCWGGGVKTRPLRKSLLQPKFVKEFFPRSTNLSSFAHKNPFPLQWRNHQKEAKKKCVQKNAKAWSDTIAGGVYSGEQKPRSSPRKAGKSHGFTDGDPWEKREVYSLIRRYCSRGKRARGIPKSS